MLPARIVALLLFTVALIFALLLCRRQRWTSIPLILVASWLVHGVIYYIAQVIFSFVYCCPYPSELAMIVNWWSTVLRLWVLIAILFVFALAYYRKGVIIYGG